MELPSTFMGHPLVIDPAMPAQKGEFGQWAESSTTAADIKASLADAFETILDASLKAVQDDDFRVVISTATYHRIKTWAARGMWKDAYRSARVLGNKQLAFEFIGERRWF